MKEESTSNVFVHERNASDSDAFVEPGDDEWQKDDYLPLETNNDIRKKDLDDRDKEENSDMDQSDVDATIPPEADEPWNLRMSPPWIQEDGRVDRRDQSTHPITALHNEIVSFVHLLEPLPSEIEQREELICRIRDTVQRFFPNGTRVVVFGSQATGLFLPTSDIDLVIMSPSEDKKAESKQSQTLNRDDENDVVNYTLAPQSPLHCFAQSIRQDWGIDEFSYMELVENTRIPLVKFTHAATRINVDVSFDQPSGPPAAHLMKRYLEALPPLRPLTFVLKYFLAARCLNEPYTGGVGSFLLQLMIVSFLQHRERDAVNYQRPSVYNLGTLLLEFLELYGLDFNYYTTGISVRYDGFYFPKGAADRRTTFWKLDRMSMVSIFVSIAIAFYRQKLTIGFV
jgi:non-canonical poly(A) RNA polymerase PAPD5/7